MLRWLRNWFNNTDDEQATTKKFEELAKIIQPLHDEVLEQFENDVDNIAIEFGDDTVSLNIYTKHGSVIEAAPGTLDYVRIYHLREDRELQETRKAISKDLDNTVECIKFWIENPV